MSITQIIAVVFVVLLAILAPMGLIWAVNTLFNLGIILTWKTWGAAFLLLLLLAPNRTSK